MKTLHVCIAADNNYKLPLQCLVNSIYKNAGAHECVIHILYDGLARRFQKGLIKRYQGTNISLDFIDMSKYQFNFNGINMQYWTRAIFYRIMIPEIFKDIKRILYLDGDTLVLGDLNGLFNMNMGDDFLLAMVADRFSWTHQMFRLNVSNYFNSGMILFDLEKCRTNNFSQKCIKWLCDNANRAIYPDQDAINVVCNNKIMRVNNMYNKMLDPQKRDDSDNGDVIIAHFLSEKKPWAYNYPIKNNRLYLGYIPYWYQRLWVIAKQNLYNFLRFCFHVETKQRLNKTKIVTIKKIMIFNINIASKKHSDNIDVITKMKQNKVDCECI